MKSIWLFFHPGSGGSTIEYALRAFSDLPCLPADIRSSPDQNGFGGFNSHHFRKQWHPVQTSEVKHLIEKQVAECNIFTPIVPPIDFKNIRTLTNAVDATTDSMWYIGPTSDKTSLLSLNLNEKTRDRRSTNPKFCGPLRINQFQHFTGGYLLLKNYIQTQDLFQKILAGEGATLIDTFDFMRYPLKYIEQIAEAAGGKIIRREELIAYLDKWQAGNKHYLDDYADYLAGEENLSPFYQEVKRQIP